MTRPNGQETPRRQKSKKRRASSSSSSSSSSKSGSEKSEGKKKCAKWGEWKQKQRQSRAKRDASEDKQSERLPAVAKRQAAVAKLREQLATAKAQAKEARVDAVRARWGLKEASQEDDLSKGWKAPKMKVGGKAEILDNNKWKLDKEAESLESRWGTLPSNPPAVVLG